MTLLGTALTALSPDDMLSLVTKYGPAIEALIQFIELHRDDKVRAQAMDSITRGFQYASQTGDPSQVSAAILAHCDATDGCRVR